MRDSTRKMPKTIVGFDIGNRKCTFVVLNNKGERLDRGEVPTRGGPVHSFFSQYKRARVVMEASTDSGWISRTVESLGHEAIVAHPRTLHAISSSSKKSDKNDAQILAELGLMEGQLMSITRVKHRSAEAQADLVTLQARDALVEARTKLINFVRAMVKSCGERVVGCSSHSFPDRAKEKIPAEIRLALLPILETIRHFGVRIRDYDRDIAALCKDKYPQTALLMQVQGVGQLTALAYVLVLHDPGRFRQSRDVGPYLGLVPRQDQSGESDPQLGITKCGNGFLRRLLVGSAQYILGPFNTKDSDLKRYGARICVRGGKNSKRRAVVAVARKLAVLLHRLWVSGETYEPLRNSEPNAGGRRKGKMVVTSPAA